MTAAGTVELDTPFADVRAVGLRWALGLPARDAVAVLAVELPAGRRVELRVLGASHQVLVERDARLVLSETVACDLPAASALPEQELRDGYAFSSEVLRLSHDQLAEQVTALEARLAADPQAIVARFTGTPYAVTAIAVETGPHLAWTTWHAYPQSGELVRTRTVLRPDPQEQP